MLKERALSATLWSGVDMFLRQGLQLATTIVLARLLTPADFGTVAVLALFIGTATVLMDGGFSAALIQRQDVDHTDESTVFWFNLGAGAAVALCLCAIAPVLASFYRLPVLKPLTYVMALAVFIAALGAIHSTLLSKRLDFRVQMQVSALAALASGGIGIVLAWRGYGVWALAAQSVAMTSATTGLFWLINPWRPTCQFSRASARKLVGFGGYHLASSLLEVIYSRLYTLLIGRMYGPRELGFYTNADTIKQMPGGFLTGVLSRVAFPMFSAEAADKVKLRRGTQMAIRGLMLINAPMMLGMSAVAEPLVRAIFGPQWLPGVPILRVLCLAGLLWPLHVINLNVLMAQGHSRLMFRVEVTKKLVGLALLSIGALHGVMGIAWSQVVFSVVGLCINTYYTGRFLDYGAAAQVRDVLPVTCLAMFVGGIVFFVSAHWEAAPFVELVGLTALGAAVFLLVGSLSQMDAIKDVVSMFRSTKFGLKDPGIQ